jgi:hypothetical protein
MNLAQLDGHRVSSGQFAENQPVRRRYVEARVTFLPQCHQPSIG